MRITSIVLLGVVAAAAAGPAAAQQPTLSDIALCNERAAAKSDGSSALPGPSPRAPAPPPRQAPEPTPPGPVPPRPPAGSEKTDPSGSIVTESPDPFLKGMDAEKLKDPEYRAAYRACMQERTSGR